MKRKFWMAAGGTILLLLFPYITTLFITGKITVHQEIITKSGKTILIAGELGTEKIDLEEYIVGVAAAQIPGDYEEEALKAQAIIVRTYLYKTMGEENTVQSSVFSCDYWNLDTRQKQWGDDFEEYQDKFERAAAETSGLVLLYEGNLIDAMFHRASAGSTRNAGDAFPYLKSVSSSQDVDMDGYVTIREFSGEELAAAIESLDGQKITAEDALGLQVVARDEAGYVETVMAGTAQYSGDELAAALLLPSAAFSVSQTEAGLKFVDKGAGHGYGFSQWGANKLALEGQDAAEILTYYYQGVAMEKR